MLRSRRLWVLIALLPACSSDAEPQPSLDPAGSPASAELSDEFDDPSTRSRWRLWHEVAGLDPRHDLLDIAETNPGMLTIRPKAGGWYGGEEGPLLYTMIQGDFLVETWVSASKVGDPSAPPDQPFNSAGLLVRDPVHGEGRANWIMLNVGRQRDSRVATEGKTTVNSQSTLELTDGARQGRLRICRRGSTFVLARQLEGETEFTVTQRWDRTDLPADLQVGLVATGWNSAEEQPDRSRTPDIEGTFDWVHVSLPSSDADCTAD